LDTLPYWYSGAVRRFADLNREEFFDAPERWIVDRWDVQSNPWRWDDEPRQHRFSERSLLSMHSHGSLPTMERFRTYLEWHAMWCATGELMLTRALARAGEDDYDTFERWLSREGVTAPPLWLADLCGMKPLENRLWFAPLLTADPFDRLRVAPSLTRRRPLGPVDRRIRTAYRLIATESRRSVTRPAAAGCRAP